MTNLEALKEWKKEFAEFLSSLGIVSLRSLGRYVGVPQATTKKKGELTACILAVVSGDAKPAVKSNRGAPVKEDFVDPAILSKLEELYFKKAAIEAECLEKDKKLPDSRAFSAAGNVNDSAVALSLHAKNQETPYYEREVFCGELIMLAGTHCIKITEPREYFGEKAVALSGTVEKSGARTGDKITFHAKQCGRFFVVTEILSVNTVLPGELFENFDKADAEYPNEKLLNFEAGQNVLLKYFTALFPVGKGQRVILSGAPKSGKSTLLREVARAAARKDKDLKIVIALCEQSPESVGEWQREFTQTEIYASSYCDDAEEQFLMAEKALKCAKEHACDGKSVFLLVDNLNALARAFNETEESLGGRTLVGGLESKTVHYLKKYLGSARQLKGGTSVTIFGVLCTETGSPFDATLSQELLGISSATWQLSGVFSRGKSASPDYAASHVDNEDKFLASEEKKTLERLCDAGAERVFELGKEDLLKESRSEYDFLNRILSAF